MSRESAMAGIQRAAELINNQEFNRLVESKAPYKSSSKQLGNGRGRSVGNDLAAFEAQAGLAATSKSRQQSTILNEDGRELPDFNTIKQSMVQNPTPQMRQSASYIMMQQQPQQQIISETVQQPMPMQTYGGQGIDYNYLKYIINECIKENMKTQLNENLTLSGIKMAGGNTIQFMDSKGNIYEGTLKLIKRGSK